jgi:large subunit ribosomal protein L30e
MAIEKEIKDAMKEKKLVVGTRMIIKNIKKDAVKYVICPENCRDDVLEDLDYYSRNFGIEIRKFSGNSRQLGEICGKPFNIMLLGIKK